MLRRNLRGCSRSIKSTAYLALVRLNLEYSMPPAFVTLTSPNINKLEMIEQRKAARYVCNNYDRHASVTNMLNDLGWDTLEHRRKAARLVQIFFFRVSTSLMKCSAPEDSRTVRCKRAMREHKISNKLKCRT